MQTNNALLGLFPDLTYNFNDNCLYISYTQAGSLKVSRFDLINQIFQTVFDQPIENQGFSRIRNVDGKLYLIYREGNGSVINLVELSNNNNIVPFSGRFENWPCTLGNKTFAINNLTRPHQGEPEPKCVIINYSTFNTSEIPPFAGTGLAFQDSNDLPISVDENRASKIQFGLYNPQFAGRLFCGEGITGGVPLVDSITEKKIIIEEGTETFVPKIVQYGDRWAIATGNMREIKIIFDISLEDVLGVGIPVPVPIPPPVNNDIVINLKSGQRAIITRE